MNQPAKSSNAIQNVPSVASFEKESIWRRWLVHEGSLSDHLPVHSDAPWKPRSRTILPHVAMSPPVSAQ